MLATRLPKGASAEQIADAIVVIWSDINQTLHPIIGFRGVAALFNRSLNIAAATYPWIAERRSGALAELDSSALKSALLNRPPSEAAAGGAALFVTFHELLASLIGSTLTEQLLRPVLIHPSGAAPAQDPSP